MKLKMKLYVTVALIVVMCVASSFSVSASYYANDNDILYNYDTDAQAAYVWTDLTYNTTSNTIKADCWITYKNGYPSVLHNCANLVIFTSSGSRNSYYKSTNSGRNVVIEKTAPTGFTWCYTDHAINTCTTNHTYTHASNCGNVTLYTYVRVS